jgi:homoserine dehydrogenase
MSRKKLRIGLIGFGCVGQGLYEALSKTPALEASIARICVRDRNKVRPLEAGLFTFDRAEILDDPSINVVVELTDDADAAYEIVTEALRRGKSVVSANKKMIATHFEELIALQRETGSQLLYEAACCASMPIIRNLEEYYDNDLLECVEGILNGSTNYILSKTYTEGMSYREALAQAQKNGYAESDPSLDTEGFDARNKLVILIAHAFGKVAAPEEICRLGIDRIGRLELDYAKEKGKKIKLVAQAYRCPDGKIAAFVLPKFVSPNDKLFLVDDVYNGVVTCTRFADTQFFVGKGAGSLPTASAVLSDLSALRYDYRYEYKKLGENAALQSKDDIFLRVLLRIPDRSPGGLTASFIEIHERYSNRDCSFITGVISLSDLEWTLSSEQVCSCVLFEVAEDPFPKWKAAEHVESQNEIAV